MQEKQFIMSLVYSYSLWLKGTWVHSVFDDESENIKFRKLKSAKGVLKHKRVEI